MPEIVEPERIVTKDIEVHGGVQWTMVGGTTAEGGSDQIVREYNLEGGKVVTPEEAIAKDGKDMIEVTQHSNVGFRMKTEQFTVRAKGAGGAEKTKIDSRILYQKKMRAGQENNPQNIDKASIEQK